MKTFLICLFLLVGFACFSQPTNYNFFNTKNVWTGGAFNMFNFPSGTTAAFGTNQWRRAGAAMYDTVGADSGLWVHSGTAWKRVLFSGEATSITNLGSGFRLWKPQTPGLATLTATNGLTADSATSGQIGIKLGGTLTANTIINGASYTKSLTFEALDGVFIDYYLDVNGIKIWRGSATRSIFITSDPGTLASVNSGSDNTAMGYGAMKNLNGGVANVALGRQALKGNTNGNNNVAIGYDALTTPTSMDNSIAIGREAMQQAVNGVDNIAIGQESYVFGSGSQNVAVGNYALYSGTGPSIGFNTAIGDHAMNANTTGNGNVAVGTNALLINTTGIKNTAVGSGAGESLTTGSWNTAIGQDALLNVSTGIRNIGIGWNAGKIESGDANISIGYEVAATVTKGSNNIFIGGFNTGSGVAQEDTVSHSIVIGSYAYSTQSNQMVLGSDSISDTRIFGLNRVTSTSWIATYDSATHKVSYIPASLLSGGGGGGGSVTSFTFTDGNGFDGTVTNSTTTPTLSLTTTVTDDQVMFSNSGAIAGSSNFVYDGNSLKSHAASTMGVVFSAADGVEQYLMAEDATPSGGEVFMSARMVATNYAQLTFSNRAGGNSTIQHIGGGEFNISSSAGANLNLKGEGTQGIALSGSNITSSLQHQFELQLKIKDISSPSTPASGYGSLYVNSDRTRFKSDAGTDFFIPNTLQGSSTLNFPSVAAQGEEQLTITVTGAADGDEVVLGVPSSAANAGIVYSAYVSTTDTVVILAHNYSSSSHDPASGTFKVSVIKR